MCMSPDRGAGCFLLFRFRAYQSLTEEMSERWVLYPFFIYTMYSREAKYDNRGVT